MGEKYLVVPVSDLRYFEFTCPKCGTGFTYDMQGEKSSFPEDCPACGVDYDSFTGTLPQSFSGYKKFFQTFGKLKDFDPGFRIKGE